jgi:hypothetical protein
MRLLLLRMGMRLLSELLGLLLLGLSLLLLLLRMMRLLLKKMLLLFMRKSLSLSLSLSLLLVLLVLMLMLLLLLSVHLERVFIVRGHLIITLLHLFARHPRHTSHRMLLLLRSLRRERCGQSGGVDPASSSSCATATADPVHPVWLLLGRVRLG